MMRELKPKSSQPVQRVSEWVSEEVPNAACRQERGPGQSPLESTPADPTPPNPSCHGAGRWPVPLGASEGGLGHRSQWVTMILTWNVTSTWHPLEAPDGLFFSFFFLFSRHPRRILGECRYTRGLLLQPCLSVNLSIYRMCYEVCDEVNMCYN